MSFIDSPEYIARHTRRGAIFSVRIIALPPSPPLPPPASPTLPPSSTACSILTFPYTNLTSPPTPLHLLSTLDALVCRDVTEKLFTTGEVVRGLVKLKQLMREGGGRGEGWKGETKEEAEEENGRDEEKVGRVGSGDVWSEAAVRLTSGEREWT